MKSTIYESYIKNPIGLVAVLIILPPLLAFAMGAVWGIVDWLRNYGMGVSPFPYFDHPQFQVETFRHQTAGTMLGGIEDLINWYNATFRGATRFGSGIGYIAGAFIVFGLCKEQKLPLRLLVGAITGMMIGTRSVLMLGSGAPLFVVGLATGGIIGALYIAFGEANGTARSLPIRKVSEIS
jgi:hypothetical protein